MRVGGSRQGDKQTQMPSERMAPQEADGALTFPVDTLTIVPSCGWRDWGPPRRVQEETDRFVECLPLFPIHALECCLPLFLPGDSGGFSAAF